MKLLFGIFSFVLIAAAVLNAQQKKEDLEPRVFKYKKFPEELRKYFKDDSLKIYPKFFNDSLLVQRDGNIDYKIRKHFPDPNIDNKILVFKPDSSIDYKILKKKF